MLEVAALWSNSHSHWRYIFLRCEIKSRQVTGVAAIVREPSVWFSKWATCRLENSKAETDLKPCCVMISERYLHEIYMQSQKYRSLNMSPHALSSFAGQVASDHDPSKQSNGFSLTSRDASALWLSAAKRTSKVQQAHSMRQHNICHGLNGQVGRRPQCELGKPQTTNHDLLLEPPSDDF